MSDKLKRDVRNLRDFTKIDLRGAGNIELIQGDDFEVIIEAEDYILEYLTTEVRDKTLVIGFEKDRPRLITQTDESIIYTITIPLVEGIRIAGGGKVHAETVAGQSFTLDLPGSSNVKIAKLDMNLVTISVPGSAKVAIDKVKTETTSIHIPGSGHIELPQFEAQNLTVNIQGAGNVTIEGTCSQQTVSITGVGNYKGQLLQSKQATVHSPGLGNANLWVTDNLIVNLSGMGNVHYFGDARVTKTVRGIGHVKHIGSALLEMV
jgi:hypothetical protein